MPGHGEAAGALEDNLGRAECEERLTARGLTAPRA